MKLVLIRRKLLTIAACAIAACTMFYIVNHPAIVGAAANTRELPIYSVQLDYKAVSLTFDAAWGNEDIEQLIEILNQYHIKATFFVVGEWAERYPESVAALYNVGHEIMNHSNTHAHMNPLSRKEIMADLAACNDKIEAITGQRPTLFRPPYGEYDDHVVEAARALGLEAVQWSIDSLDWKDYPAEKIMGRVVGQVEPGSIILLHNATANTSQALPGIIEALLQKGYAIVPVSQLLLPQPYAVDHTGRQQPAPSGTGAANSNCGVEPCLCPEGTCQCEVCVSS